MLVVRSTPPGAQIVLDDKVVGVTDMDFRVYPGRHIVRLEKSGFAAETREVAIDDGEHAEVDVMLKPRKAPRQKPKPASAMAAERPEPARRSRLVPWLVVGAGGAALATGGLLLTMDENGSSGGGLRNRGFDDTTKVGIGLGGAGLVVMGAGIYLLVRRADETAPAPIVSVDGDAAWVGVRGGF